MTMRFADKLLSTYQDSTLKAMTFITSDGDFGVRFYKDQVWQKDEIYKGHSEQYADDAAENYVLGVKHL
tara:strand:- start:4429 stop:4635 length:207 start_codon:yes stop_codon:yes gene_type:complete